MHYSFILLSIAFCTESDAFVTEEKSRTAAIAFEIEGVPLGTGVISPGFCAIGMMCN